MSKKLSKEYIALLALKNPGPGRYFSSEMIELTTEEFLDKHPVEDSQCNNCGKWKLQHKIVESAQTLLSGTTIDTYRFFCEDGTIFSFW